MLNFDIILHFSFGNEVRTAHAYLCTGKKIHAQQRLPCTMQPYKMYKNENKNEKGPQD
jgi:hypothetical protein